MKKKKITGLIVLIVGIALIVFAVHSMNRIANAKEGISAITTPFSNEPAGKFVGDVLEGKASQYDVQVKLCLIGGIVLAVIGGGMLLFCRKK
jgi:hypothetical protein